MVGTSLGVGRRLSERGVGLCGLPLPHHHHLLLFCMCVTALILFSPRHLIALETEFNLDGVFFLLLVICSINPAERQMFQTQINESLQLHGVRVVFLFFFNSTFWCSSSGKGPCLCLQTQPAHYFTGTINEKSARWAMCLPDSATKPELAEET